MMIETNPENTVYGSYGVFDPYDTDTWTDEDWQEYDAYVAEEMDRYDDLDEFGYDPEPPF